MLIGFVELWFSSNAQFELQFSEMFRGVIWKVIPRLQIISIADPWDVDGKYV